MADRTGIEWTDATWNPVRGCSRVSEGCRHCYAERVAARFSGSGQPYEGTIHPSTKGWNGKVRLVTGVLDQPLRWSRPRRIFVNSMSDLFHEDVPDGFIAAVFAVAAAAPRHTFQILTKRPKRALRWFATMESATAAKLHECLKGAMGYEHPRRPAINYAAWPLPNVWLGVSVEDQAAADERIPLLLQCPAAVRWISAEPLLGPVGLWPEWLHTNENTGRVGLDWVVAGGESGPGARPMSPDWVRSLRNQCALAEVPFLFKQWGDWLPMLGQVEGVQVSGEKVTTSDGWVMGRAGKKAAGRSLDGRLHDEYPEARHA